MSIKQELDWLQRAQKISNLGNWDQDYPDGKLWWSDQVYRIFGLEPQSVEMDFEKFLGYVHPDDRPSIRRATEEILSTESVPYKIEYRLLLEKNGERYIYEEAVVDRDQNGCPVKMAGIIQDVTDRRRAENTLRESEERYRSLVESTAAAAWEMDLQTMKFTYVSPVVEDMLGYPVSDWTDFDFWADHLHPEDRDEAVNFCIVETGKGNDHEFQYRFLAADGRIVWIRDIVSIDNKNGSGRTLRGLFMDITELKEKHELLDRSNKELEAVVKERTRETLVLQKELMVQEKLAEVGRLAAGVRHDLRNPLGVISNSVYFLKMKLSASEDKKILKHLALIEKESSRCNEIISELLDYSKVMSPRPVETNIIPYLREQFEAIGLPSEVSLLFDCGDQVFQAMIDAGQISRVVRNLVDNAVHAMGGKGELVISCRRDGKMVAISFADNGRGIPAENLIRIFDPLFSTKENGMGMGLANVRNFVNLHKGEIEVESEVGKGSVFTIRLPTL